MWYITGTVTFSTAAGRTTARTALDSAAAGKQLWSGGIYLAGLTNVGTTGLTISFSASTEAEALSFYQALVTSAYGQARTAGHISVNGDIRLAAS